MDLLLNRGPAETKRATIDELLNDGNLNADAFAVWVFSPPMGSEPLEPVHLEQIAGAALGRQVFVHPAGEGMHPSFALLIALQEEETGGQQLLADQLLQALDLPVAAEEAFPQEQIEAEGGIIGVGSPRDNMERISESFRESQSAYNFAVFNGLTGAITADEEHRARQQFTADSEVFTHQFRELTKRLRYELGSGSPAGPVIGELFNLLIVQPGAGKSYISALLSGLIESCSSLVMSADAAATAAATDHMESLLACRRLPDMRVYMTAVIADVALILEEKRNRKDDFLIQRVIGLIEEHYGNQDLNLAFIAGEVFVSPNHLGMIFKKKTGKTPSEYIQEFRLARAEEMLRTTKQRISVVAEQIGIPNPSYFGLLYKQVYGMTPGEYREVVQR
jgi:two-component system response regulator YesN